MVSAESSFSLTPWGRWWVGGQPQSKFCLESRVISLLCPMSVMGALVCGRWFYREGWGSFASLLEDSSPGKVCACELLADKPHSSWGKGAAPGMGICGRRVQQRLLEVLCYVCPELTM